MRTRLALTAAGALALGAALGACAGAGGGTGAGTADGAEIGLRVAAAAPARSVPTEGGTLTVFELEISNRGEAPVLLERVAAVTEEESLDAPALALRLVPRVRAEPARRLLLAEGARTALLCRELGAPVAVDREIEATGTNTHGHRVRATSRASVAAEVGAPPRILGAPLEGGGWLVENGPSTFSGHRRAIVWIDRRPRAAQRFAVDFFRVDASGATSRGPRAEDHLAFGARVLAVADGVVAAAVDGIPDNAPGPSERSVEMSHATVAGNHVVIDLGGGAYAMFAHLRQGSVAVRAGDRVVRGQALGEIGNSGNSTEPHLHLHVADGPSPVDADGLPFVLDAFRVERGAEPGQRAGLLPGEGSVVEFPPSRENSATNGAPQAAETR